VAALSTSSGWTPPDASPCAAGRRSDVATHLGLRDLYAGYCVEFFLPPGELDGLVVLEGAREVFRLPRKARSSAPHYGNLFEEKQVLHRDDIYGYGATSQFKSLVCTEVSEHIAAYQDVLPEMARVAERALITVPDMSAIPALHPHHVVPWLLLESTHVNFFTQASLERTLRPYFPRLSFARTGES
jgi:hypothetical protein